MKTPALFNNSSFVKSSACACIHRSCCCCSVVVLREPTLKESTWKTSGPANIQGRLSRVGRSMTCGSNISMGRWRGTTRPAANKSQSCDVYAEFVEK